MFATRQLLAGLIAATSILGVGACGLGPSTPRWKVDVVNGDGPLQLGITTDREAWIWIVPAGAQMVLLDLPESREGSIELVDRDCRLLDTTLFSSTSFTIVLEPFAGEPPDVKLRMEPGASLAGPVNVDYEAWCTG